LRARGKQRRESAGKREQRAHTSHQRRNHRTRASREREGKGGEREREERGGSPGIGRWAAAVRRRLRDPHPIRVRDFRPTTETPAPSVAVNPATTPAPFATISGTSPPPPPSPAPLCRYALPSWLLLPLFFLQSSTPLSTAALLFLPLLSLLCFLNSCSALLLSVICGAM
jgi:hypothetical protein